MWRLQNVSVSSPFYSQRSHKQMCSSQLQTQPGGFEVKGRSKLKIQTFGTTFKKVNLSRKPESCWTLLLTRAISFGKIPIFIW